MPPSSMGSWAAPVLLARRGFSRSRQRCRQPRASGGLTRTTGGLRWGHQQVRSRASREKDDVRRTGSDWRIPDCGRLRDRRPLDVPGLETPLSRYGAGARPARALLHLALADVVQKGRFLPVVPVRVGVLNETEKAAVTVIEANGGSQPAWKSTRPHGKKPALRRWLPPSCWEAHRFCEGRARALRPCWPTVGHRCSGRRSRAQQG